MRVSLRLLAALMIMFAFDAAVYRGYYGQAALGAASRQGALLDYKIHNWMRRGN